MLTARRIMLAARLMAQTGQMDDIVGAATGVPASDREGLLQSILPLEEDNKPEAVRVDIVQTRHKVTGEIGLNHRSAVTEDGDWEIHSS